MLSSGVVIGGAEIVSTIETMKMLERMSALAAAISVLISLAASVAASETASMDDEIKLRVLVDAGAPARGQATEISPTPDSSRPGDRVIAEVARSVPWNWTEAMLVIVPTHCNESSRSFSLVLYHPRQTRLDPHVDIGKPEPTPELYKAVEDLFALMRKMKMDEPRAGVFTLSKTRSGAWSGFAWYDQSLQED